MAHSVIVYGTASCPYCIRLKQFLAEKQVPYTLKEVDRDRAALAEMKARSGQLSVPVVDIDGKLLVGFDPAALTRELGLE